MRPPGARVDHHTGGVDDADDAGTAVVAVAMRSAMIDWVIIAQRKPGAKTRLWLLIIAQVPFSAKGCLVAGSREKLGQCCLIL